MNYILLTASYYQSAGIYQFSSFACLVEITNFNFFFQELYHEMHALDRFEQDYQRKQQEEDGSSVHQRG